RARPGSGRRRRAEPVAPPATPDTPERPPATPGTPAVLPATPDRRAARPAIPGGPVPGAAGAAPTSGGWRPLPARPTAAAGTATGSCTIRTARPDRHRRGARTAAARPATTPDPRHQAAPAARPR